MPGSLLVPVPRLSARGSCAAGNTFRFVRPGAYNPEDQKKAEEDSAFFAQVFTYSAEAANAEAAE